MKYCEKCGNQLMDEAVMCPKCGSAAGKSEAQKQQDAQSKNQTKGAILILAGIAIIVILILLAMSQY